MLSMANHLGLIEYDGGGMGTGYLGQPLAGPRLQPGKMGFISANFSTALFSLIRKGTG